MKKIKIFIVTTELPARVGGAPVRNFNLIKYMSKDMFHVSLFTIIDTKTKIILPTIREELSIPIYTVPFKGFNIIKKLYLSISKRVIPYMEEFKNADISSILLNRLKKEQPEIIQLELINAYYAIQDVLPYIKAHNIKIILDAHNVEQVVFKESLGIFNFIKKSIGKWILPNLERIENGAARSADHVFTCSDIDKAYFDKIVGANKVTVIPNGVDTVFFKPIKKNLENALLFMGSVNYPPNEEALRYYFTHIHPLVKKRISDIKIYVLCGKPSRWIRNAANNDSSVILLGFIDDVREYLRKAKICISPIRSGSGTSLKILEYMGMEKPVVSTSIGARGIDVKNYKNILIADNPLDFANKISWLIENPKEAKIIGKNARKLIREKYDWKFIGKKAENAYRKIIYENNYK